MAITPEELRLQLSNEEPNYQQLATKITLEDIPALAALAQGPDKMLASKAIYLASLLPSPQAHQIVEAAALSSEPLLKIASASALVNVPDVVKNRISERLIDDENLSIKKLVIQAIPVQASPQLQQKLNKLSVESPNEAIRNLSKTSLTKINR